MDKDLPIRLTYSKILKDLRYFKEAKDLRGGRNWPIKQQMVEFKNERYFILGQSLGYYVMMIEDLYVALANNADGDLTARISRAIDGFKERTNLTDLISPPGVVLITLPSPPSPSQLPP